jgi:hypothetical protein
VFGCTCYPNLSTKVAHKQAPQSIRCVFFRYSADHKGCQCLDLTTNNIVISRHVIFYETDFPFSISPRPTNDLDIFLQDDSPGVAPMLAPLPAPHVPEAFHRWQSNCTFGRLDHAQNRGWRSDHEPRRSEHPRNRGWWSARPPRRSDHSWNGGWRSDLHPRRPDHLTLRGSLHRLLRRIRLCPTQRP